MSPFDLSQYEPVEERLRAFWRDHPMGRIETEMVHVGGDGYIVKASIWRGFEVKSERPGEVPPPGATGYAQEAVTERGVNATSALENCETSAIGRALANLGYAAKGKRPSREEMTKASAASSPARISGADKASGRDGASERGGEGSGAYGEGAAAPEPPPSVAGPHDPHPNKPHILKPSKTLEGATYCIIKGCDYVLAPGDAKPVRT